MQLKLKKKRIFIFKNVELLCISHFAKTIFLIRRLRIPPKCIYFVDFDRKAKDSYPEQAKSNFVKRLTESMLSEHFLIFLPKKLSPAYFFLLKFP